MERYYSIGQSPQRVVAPTEEEQEEEGVSTKIPCKFLLCLMFYTCRTNLNLLVFSAPITQ
jgi:hypothetical protein